MDFVSGVVKFFLCIGNLFFAIRNFLSAFGQLLSAFVQIGFGFFNFSSALGKFLLSIFYFDSTFFQFIPCSFKPAVCLSFCLIILSQKLLVCRGSLGSINLGFESIKLCICISLFAVVCFYAGIILVSCIF